MGIIYLLQPSEFRNTSIYKIGRSSKDDLSRCISYGKNAKYVVIRDCENHIEVEKSIIREFNLNLTLIQGREYFEGNVDKMIDIINRTILASNVAQDMQEHQHFQELQESEKQLDSNVSEIKSGEESESLEIIRKKKYKKYVCETCNFISLNKNDHRRHLRTKKHKRNEYEAENEIQNRNCCKSCCKTFSTRQGLWLHKKKCENLKEDISLNNLQEKAKIDESSKMIEKLLDQNINLQNQLVNLLKFKFE